MKPFLRFIGPYLEVSGTDYLSNFVNTRKEPLTKYYIVFSVMGPSRF